LIIPFASALAVPILAAVAPRPKTLYRKKSRFDIFFAILVPEKTAIKFQLAKNTFIDMNPRVLTTRNEEFNPITSAPSPPLLKERGPGGEAN